jgi:Rrf2 family protein
LPPYITSMRVTTWAEYGLIVSVNLAKRAGQGPVAARELAEQERLPHDYVEQILLRLRRAGLVDSVRGAKGGYHLAREPHVITVKDVIEASEHVTFEVNCDLHPVDPQRCSPEAACSIRPVWRMLEQRINDLLAGISLADLTHDEPELYHIAGALAGN